MGNCYILQIVDGKLVAFDGPGEFLETLRTREDVDRFCYFHDDKPISCSSTLDFPEEATDDPQVIALCDYIRNGEEPTP